MGPENKNLLSFHLGLQYYIFLVKKQKAKFCFRFSYVKHNEFFPPNEKKREENQRYLVK
jgi:hypothetical protein